MTIQQLNKQITKRRFNKVTRNTDVLVGGKLWINEWNLDKLINKGK